MATSNNFLKLSALGYSRLVPIIPPKADISETSSLHRQLGKATDPRGKAVGVKGRNGKWYGFDWVPYEATEDDLPRWHEMGAGVGVKTGDGLVMIDADTLNEDHAKIIRDAISLIIPLNSVRVGNYPKAGYVVRTDKDFRYTRVEFGERDDKGRLLDRVEILADGRQFVAHGVHPKTGKPYSWPKGMPAFDDLPFVSGDMLLALLENLRQKLPSASPIVKEGATTEVNQTALKGDLDRVRSAVRATPNTTELFPTREAYRDYGYAIKAALPDNQHEAFELFAEWCDKWEGGNDPDTVQSDWRRMKPPFRRGAPWLYEIAERHSDGRFTTAFAYFDDLGDEEQNPFAQQIDLNALKEKSSKFVFLDFDEAADAAIDDGSAPLIKGLLDNGSMSVIYGDSNVGKTFVTMDMAYHIAAGLPYGGMKVNPCRVVYVAAEGGRGARMRVKALREKYGSLPDRKAFRLLPTSVDFRRPDADLNPFLEALKALGQDVGLVVVDTLSRAMAGGDENSSVDMGAIVKNFDVIRQATRAHLMIVHHTGKNKANGARGHSLLRAATDTEIEVEEGSIAVTKQRDLDKSWASAFSLEVRTLGVDADGMPVTSCTIRLIGREEARDLRLATTATEDRVLDALEDSLEGMKEGAGGVRLEDVLANSGDTLAGMSTEKLRFHLKSLKEKGHVVQPKRGIWALKVEEMASSISDPKQLSKNEAEESGGKAEIDIFE